MFNGVDLQNFANSLEENCVSLSETNISGTSNLENISFKNLRNSLIQLKSDVYTSKFWVISKISQSIPGQYTKLLISDFILLIRERQI